MALKRNMTCGEMVEFLDDKLLPQANALRVLITPDKQPGAYSVVVRHLLCTVDFLGATCSGSTSRCGTSRRAIRFITKYFKPEDVYSEEIAGKLYTIYRHGLVHMFQPKVLRLNGDILEWKFDRVRTPDHLRIIPVGQGRRSSLMVSVKNLHEDFDKAVELYRDELKNSLPLQAKWRNVVDAICTPC